MMKDVIKKRACEDNAVTISQELDNHELKSPIRDGEDSIIGVEVPVEEILADDRKELPPKITVQVFLNIIK